MPPRKKRKKRREGVKNNKIPTMIKVDLHRKKKKKEKKKRHPFFQTTPAEGYTGRKVPKPTLVSKWKRKKGGEKTKVFFPRNGWKI